MKEVRQGQDHHSNVSHLSIGTFEGPKVITYNDANHSLKRSTKGKRDSRQRHFGAKNDVDEGEAGAPLLFVSYPTGNGVEESFVDEKLVSQSLKCANKPCLCPFSRTLKAFV